MTDEEFGQLMALPHELRGVEFKGPGPCRRGPLLAQIVKVVLGMANRRNGGQVIIGVEDTGGMLRPVGLSDTDAATWNYDHVADGIARYADPGVAFELEVSEYNGNKYVAILVEEFADIPVLCKRAYADILREGACYVRTGRKPETSDIPTQADMRDLLDLATQKGVRSFLDQAQRLGLLVLPTVAHAPTDQERFNEQAGDLI